MSIFFDFNIGPSGRRFRKAVDGDKSDIEVIINHKYTEALFGQVDVGALIELSTLAICLINDQNKVTGFLAVCDHPNITGVDPAHWETWVRNMYQKYYLSRNTLFVQYMCCVDSVKDYFAEEAFKSIFRNDDYLLHIVLVLPSNCPPECITEFIRYFKKQNVYKYQPIKTDYETSRLYLYAALRKDFCPKLKIRRAVEEDNDDIVEILGKNCPRLQELYGDFYISEIIGRHPEMNRKIIVADGQDQVLGVMCLNSDVNYESLQRIYELMPYHGLRKTTPLQREVQRRSNEVLRMFGEPIMLGKWSPFRDNVKKKIIAESDKTSKLADKQQGKTQTKVIFHHDEVETKNTPMDQNSTSCWHGASPAHSVGSQYFSAMDLEEDTFDYEFVNIDDKLLMMLPIATSEEFLLSPEIKRRISRVMEARESIETRRGSIHAVFNGEENYTTSCGGPNAFTIELFGMREGVHETHAFEMLEAAFESMKDFDYCIIQVPCTEKSFHLLRHFCFVPTRNNMCSKYALYVAHRNSVLSKLRVREVEVADIPQIANFLQSLDSKEIISVVEENMGRTGQLQFYLLMSLMTIVGVGILEPPEQIHFLRTHLDMETHRIHKYHIKENPGGGMAMLKEVLAYPVFEPHFRFFTREMMRLSGTTTLMWLTAYRNKWVILKANSIVSSMIPLLPRQSEINCSTPDLQEVKKMSNVISAFSSWIISRRLTSIPKVNVDTRIVVVGASRTAMAFLNALLFSDSSSYLMFTNVTLVSPTGLPYSKHPRPNADLMFNYYRTNTDRYLKNVPYTFYVNVIKSTMTDLNKREKYIELLNGSKCSYDLLFLLFGKQYQHPDYMKNTVDREKLCDNEGTSYKGILGSPSEQLPPADTRTPRNVFIINTPKDANKALSYISSIDWYEEKNRVIVYGSTTNAYCCLATLTAMSIPTSNIVFVEPFPDENPRKSRVSLFSNTYVDSTVRQVINKLRITVYSACYFQSWSVDSDNNVTQVDFLSLSKFIRLDCTAFFYYGKRGVNEHAFIAMNKSGIVYDGGILIDDKFRTRDPSIYAAGPATRYHRCHYAESQRQKYYDSYEVGWKLGTQILKQLNPLYSEKKGERSSPAERHGKTVGFDPVVVGSSDESGVGHGKTDNKSPAPDEEVKAGFKAPNFRSPVVRHCTLPGPMQYLHVRPPGKLIPHQYIQSLQHNGYVLETFKSGYFKLHLNKELRVDGVTCLTAENYSLENFKHLYGLSTVVLNNVYVRYTAKKLDNFYEFFLSPWANFLYHDHRCELFAMVKEILPKGQVHGRTLRETLHTAARQLASESSCDILGIHSRYEKTPYFEAFTEYLIEWLSENDAVLPMYLNPYQNTSLSHDPYMKTKYRKRKLRMARTLSLII